MTRFELATPRPPDVCATGLRYIPNFSKTFVVGAANIRAKRNFQSILHKILERHMDILIKKALIANTNSPFNGLQKDILVQNGVIAAIDDTIEVAAETVVEAEGLTVSAGWIDGFAHFNEPGLEYKETLQTGAAAAAAGGYCAVCVLPNTQPAIQSQTQVSYLVQKGLKLPVTILPLGAVSKQLEGKELAEMYDMQQAGAIAFSDGLYPIQNAGLMLKALQYVKAFDGTIVQMPVDKSIGAFGLINEGIVSTQLGLPGIPALAEELIVKRDIDLLAYTQSRLHISGVTTAESVQLIKAAKAKGLAVTCSVTPYHLYFCDEDLQQYDTNLKTNPPLRSKQDMLALREAVANGWIDAIASHHQPQNWDNKECEFEYAKYGMQGLQTAFAVVNSALPQLTEAAIAKLFAEHTYTYLGLSSPLIAQGSKASLTLFSKYGTTQLTKENNRSKSLNTPFLNCSLQGRVIGIVNKGAFIQS
jgi:dihydroorotase